MLRILREIFQRILGFILVMISLGYLMVISAPSFINQRLNQVPGYQGHVQSVSISINGRLNIHNIELEKLDPAVKPIISIELASIGINWNQLARGKFETNVILDSPQLHFIAMKPAPKTKGELTPNQAWQMAMKQILPLKIDTVIINKGLIHYQNRISSPEFDITLTQIQAQLSGLQKVAIESQALPAYLTIDAKVFGQADADFDLHFNPQAKTPTFKLQAQIENLQLKNMGEFLQRYTKLQAREGVFSAYIEAAASNGKIKGYFKPFLQGLKVQVPPEDQDSLLKNTYKNVVQAANSILKNEDSKQVATQVNIIGTINDPETSIWSTISTLLQNAFLDALLPGIDHSIEPVLKTP